MRARWNRRLYAAHQWLGLVGGALLLLLSVTGAALVFEAEIDEALARPLFAVAPADTVLPLDALHAAAAARIPGATGIFLRDRPAAPGRSWEFALTRPDGRYWFVHVDPHTGRVLGDRDADGSLVRVLLRLHYALLWRPIGELVICVMGLAFIGSTLTGLWIYRRALLQPFRTGVRRAAGARRIASDLHHLVGVTTLAFNLVIGVTGTVMLWGSWETVAAHLRGAASEPARPVDMPRRLSLDAAVAIAQAALPGLSVRGVVPPTDGDSAIFVRGRLPGAGVLVADAAAVEVHARTGAVVAVADPRRFTWQEWIDAVIYPLHFGNFGGLPIKLLYAVLAVAPGALAVTGFVLWRARATAARRAPHPAP